MRSPPKLSARSALLCLSWLLGAAVLPGPAAAADSGELVYLSEGNRLRRFDVDTLSDPVVVSDVFIQHAGDGSEDSDGPSAVNGRDINGMVCPFPDGSGRFIASEDTGQPSPAPGWGIFAPDGTQIGKLAATYATELPGISGNAEPFGCAFNSQGILFTVEAGTQGIGYGNGLLIMWFPPYEGFPGLPGAYPETDARSTNFCKIAVDIGTATGIAIDADDNVYVSASGLLQIQKYAPPFPTGLGPGQGCEAVDPYNGSPMAENVNRSVLVQGQLFVENYNTFTGLAMAPNGNLYAASILNGRIGEFRLDAAGTSVSETLVRNILRAPPAGTDPDFTRGSPQGIAVDSAGNVYYADLDLVGTLPNIGPGPNGKLRVIHFDENGVPLPPRIVAEGFAFPDGVSILPGNLPSSQWRTYAGGPERTFYNPGESTITADNVAGLSNRWRFRTGAIVTGSPSVALVDVPGEGPQQIVYFQSWDGFVYAVRLKDGTELWRFETEYQPGASFPNTASAHIEEVDGQTRVFIGSGHVFYALDAVTGQEIWRFVVGTGCVDENGVPPGLCSVTGERNEIESSAIVAEGSVVFGMDVNDRDGGKGGVYGLDASDGRMRWFFDLESGRTCRPDPTDEIRQFDGYHDEGQLNLPPGFLSTRSGCDFPRSPNGCENVWSTPTWDESRRLLFITSSNCDTDDDPATLKPPPPMPPYDEAIFALDPEGNAVWRWRARAVDNDDYALGAAPNLFTIDVGGQPVDVVGVGQKDGHYRVFDRDGVNEVNGIDCRVTDVATGVVGCVDPGLGGGPGEPAGFPSFPYWDTQVVPGGDLGGIPLTAAVDAERRRVLFSTAPGYDPLSPQQPTLHALDMDTGAVVWDSLDFFEIQDASFAPTSAIPDVVFFGSVLQARLRAHKTTPGAPDEGVQLLDRSLSSIPFGVAVASAPVVVDGTLLVGLGIGTRTGDPNDLSEITSRTPLALAALCVPGTSGCAECNDGIDNDLDGATDLDDPGCSRAGDVSERPECMDAIDNDHDGLADWPLDPGCRNRLSRASESPECQDGRDNDGDGAIDFAPAQGVADPDCDAAWDESEAGSAPTGGCGLMGPELLPVLFGARRLRRLQRPGRKKR